MNRILFFLMATSISLAMHGQQTLPGGVKDLFIWNLSKKTDRQTVSMLPGINKSVDTSINFSGKAYFINSNPAIFFNGRTMEMELNLGQLKGYTLFTVCQSVDTLSEQAIFSIETKDSSLAVLTDHRLASLKDYKYANYDNRPKSFPVIYSYCNQNSKDTALANRKLKFGQVPRRQSLPISSLNGIVPEVMLYSRNLSYKERLRIESYLAIKYGISLDQTYPIPYLNSRNDTIWEPYQNTAYSKNIAGIGRDDQSGLNQPKSESSQYKGLMSIESSQPLQNNKFVVWGDNGRPLYFMDKHAIPKCLGREWRINSYKSPGIKLNFATNVLSINEINPQAEGEYYWLMVDRSGKGNYPSGKTTFAKCDVMSSSRDTIRFKDMEMDTDSSGADVYTLILMPELFARCGTTSPDCGSGENGEIQIEIAGGTAPYQLYLTSLSSTSSSQTRRTSATYETFDNIKQGAYLVKVTDAKGKSYTQQIWVSNSKSWECKIASHYQITEGESITLDASLGMIKDDYSYSWATPQGGTIYSETINIDQPGKYYLSVTNAHGCNSTSEVTISQLEKSDIEKMEVFPNPITNGWFVSRVSLTREADLTFTISDQEGKVLKTTTMKGQRFYWYNGTLSKPGLYFLTVNTANSKKTMKLVVL